MPCPWHEPTIFLFCPCVRSFEGKILRDDIEVIELYLQKLNCYCLPCWYFSCSAEKESSKWLEQKSCKTRHEKMHVQVCCSSLLCWVTIDLEDLPGVIFFLSRDERGLWWGKLFAACRRKRCHRKKERASVKTSDRVQMQALSARAFVYVCARVFVCARACGRANPCSYVLKSVWVPSCWACP